MEVNSKTFPYVSFMGKALVNHSYVNLSLVDDDSNNVRCHTDLTTCCSGDEGSHRGDWYFPNGSRLPFDSALHDISQARKDRRVDLNRKRTTLQSGIYGCNIETIDSHNNKTIQKRVFVGLYTDRGI